MPWKIPHDDQCACIERMPSGKATAVGVTTKNNRLFVEGFRIQKVHWLSVLSTPLAVPIQFSLQMAGLLRQLSISEISICMSDE